MRQFGIPVRIGGAFGAESLILITTAPGYAAEELVRDNILRDLPLGFLRLLAAATGPGRAFSLQPVAADRIAIRLGAGVITGLWQVAALLNLIDASTFVGRLEEDPFITAIEIQSALTASASLADLHADLAKVNAVSRAVLTERLAPDFDLSGGLGRIWPDAAADYFFDIGLHPAQPLSAEHQALAKALLLDFDQSLAGSAFEPEVSPLIWFEQSRVPYPVEIRIEPERIGYRVESPPGALSTGLVLIGQALDLAGVRIARWSFDIREGW